MERMHKVLLVMFYPTEFMIYVDASSAREQMQCSEQESLDFSCVSYAERILVAFAERAYERYDIRCVL